MITMTFGLDGSAADEDRRPLRDKAVIATQSVRGRALGSEQAKEFIG